MDKAEHFKIKSRGPGTSASLRPRPLYGHGTELHPHLTIWCSPKQTCKKWQAAQAPLAGNFQNLVKFWGKITINFDIFQGSPNKIT